MVLQEVRVRLQGDAVSVWVLHFNDQHGARVREVVGTDVAEAFAHLEHRRNEVRSGSYVEPLEWLATLEQRRGRAFTQFQRTFMLGMASKPSTVAKWLSMNWVFRGLTKPSDSQALSEPLDREGIERLLDRIRPPLPPVVNFPPRP